MTHTQISRYKIGDETVDHVDLIDYDPESGEVSRRGLGTNDRVDVTRPEDIPEDYELLGLCENYGAPSTVWAIYQDIHGHEWCAVTLTETLAAPPGVTIPEVDVDELDDIDIDADELVDELEEQADG